MPDSKAKQLAGYAFLVVFTNDDTIDENELAMLERLALEDGEVDDEEKHVLRNIFSRVTREGVAEKSGVKSLSSALKMTFSC